MRRTSILPGAILAGAALGLGTAGALAQDATPPPDQLIEVGEGTYAFSASGYVSLVVVTDEGVIVTEPGSQFDTTRADRLKAAVAGLTDQPVRYVVYSHDHADHSTGGAVFADTAQFVSHVNAVDKIAARGEAVTPVPDIAFSDQLMLELGGRTVGLYHAGRNHSDNSIVTLVPDARVLHAVDFIPVDSLPFRGLPDSYPEEWIESLRWVEDNLDFDTLVPGHPPAMATKAEVAEVRGYLEALIASVQAAQTAGLADGSQEMIDAVRAELEPAYGTWANFEAWLPENIQGLLAAWASASGSPAPASAAP